MLRKQNDRRATRWDLDRAGDHTAREDLAFARGDPRPAQARAHAVARGFDPEIRAEEQRIGLIGETLRVRTRDGAYLSGVVIRTDRGTTRPFDVHAGDSEGQDLAGAQGSAKTGGQIGRSAPDEPLGGYAARHRYAGGTRTPRRPAAGKRDAIAGPDERGRFSRAIKDTHVGPADESPAAG